MTTRALIVAAPRSGAGKTTVTLGLLDALARRGVAVRSAKAGPDYIDPAFHAAATGRPGLNLDSWAMPPALVAGLLGEAAEDAELVLIEGAMGLFDGIPDGQGRSGAAADMARRFGIPVVLVLDVSGQSQTAAAIVRGFATHDPDVRLAGVILNRVGSDRHHRLVADAIAAVGVPVVGSIRRDDALGLPERHLGLVQADEHPALPAHLARLGEAIAAQVDLDRLQALAAPLVTSTAPAPLALRPPGQRIALASDAAFSFVYAHVLAGWRRAGAEVVTFSPLADEPPAADCDACWLPGGYPELHAGRLAAAAQFRTGLHRFAETRPVHGECGGHMVLGAMLEDAAGVRHRMAGLLDHTTSFAKRRLHLGYRQATLLQPGALGPVGATVRGHEFHYASTVDAGRDTRLAQLRDANGRDMGTAGGRRGWVTGTFFHAIAEDAP